MHLAPSAELMIMIFVLPLLPALLIFLIFPKTSVVVEGPLQGLTVRAGGAFGGYLLILLLAIYWVYLQQQLDNARVWQVRGDVILYDETNKMVRMSDIDERGLDVRIKPTLLEITPNEESIGFQVPVAIAAGKRTSMELIYPGTFRKLVEITPSKNNRSVRVDQVRGVIVISRAVKLESQPLLEIGTN